MQPIKFPLSSLLIIAMLCGSSLLGQENDAQPKVSTGFLVKRTSIDNFITDELVVGPLQKPGQAVSKLRSTFVLTSPINEQTLLWNSELCRLIAIKNDKVSKYHSLTAEGPHPMSNALGTMGKPKFFGFKMSENSVVFMYTYGLISVEESYEMAPDGRKLFQRFNVNSSAINGSYVVSDNWRRVLTADNGRWRNDNVLTLSREELAEGWTVTFHIDPSASR